MQAFELVQSLENSGISIQVQDGNLKVTGGQQFLTESIVNELRNHKAALLAHYGYSTSSIPKLSPSVKADALVLSSAQQRIYFLDKLGSGLNQFLIPIELTISGDFDVAKFIQCLKGELLSHEALNTRIRLVDGKLFQTHDALEGNEFQFVNESVTLPFEDVSQILFEVPFDLEVEKPFRVAFLQTGAGEWKLLIAFHHIAIDGWSIDLLLEGVFARYSGMQIAVKNELSYLDYAVWERAHLDNECFNVSIEYWKQYLSGFSNHLKLPRVTLEENASATESGFLELPMPADTNMQVGRFCAKHGIREHGFYLGCYFMLLHKLCNETDLAVGIDTVGRDRTELSQTIGFFVNQLVVRQKVAEQSTVSEFLKDLHKNLTESFKFQQIPFDLLVEQLGFERSVDSSPIFQVKFLYDSREKEPEQLPNIKLDYSDKRDVVSQYQLTLKVVGNKVQAFFDDSLYSEAQVNVWMDYYLGVVEQTLQSSEMNISELLWDRISTDYREVGLFNSQFKPIIDVQSAIESNFDNYAESMAIVDSQTRLTYGQLAKRVYGAANYLSLMEPEENAVIAIYAPRSADFVTAVLAVMWQGCCFLPIDIDTPEENVQHILEDSECAILIKASDIEVQDFYGVSIDLEDLVAWDGQQPCQPVKRESSLELAYLLYTSGSTGLPKGALISNESLNNLCTWYLDFAQITAASNVLLIIPMGFDASIKNYLSPLMVGGGVVCGPQDIFDPARLCDLISKEKASVLNCVPSAFYPIVQHASADDFRQLQSLSFVALGGEKPDLNLIRPWLTNNPCNATLANIYGPTECTDISIAQKFKVQALHQTRELPIGLPVNNAEIAIVDENLNVCPLGTEGEILVLGTPVSHGYVNNKAMTDKHFIKLPWTDKPVYRTGDYGKVFADRQLYYLGRRDSQIKVRGRRVELGEIQYHIAEVFPKNRVVVMHFDENGTVIIAAFIEAVNDAKLAKGKAELAEKLPNYKIPKAFLTVDRLPLTAHGKVDKAALKKIYASYDFDNINGDCQPLTRKEERVAECWQKVLNLKEVYRDSNFFSCGGDSILSIQLVAELQEAGFVIAVQDVFKYPTLQELAKVAQEVAPQETTTDNHYCAFSLVSSEDRAKLAAFEDAYPLTTMQTAMVLHNSIDAQNTTYHDLFAYQLTGGENLNYDRLQAAILSVLAKYEVLRINFNLRDFSQPLQFVHKHYRGQVQHLELTQLSEDVAHQKVQQYINGRMQHQFDIQDDCLIQFAVCELPDASFVLVIDAHHAIIDGWSMSLVLRDIYKALSEQQGADYAGEPYPDTPHFAEFVAIESGCAEQTDLRQYWQDYLKAGTSGPLFQAESYKGAVSEHYFRLSPEQVDNIDCICKAQGIPANMLFLFAHLGMLQGLTGGTNPVTAVVENGRPEIRYSEEMVGLFLNTIPVIADFGSPNLISTFEKLKDDLNNHKSRRHFPFSEIENLRTDEEAIDSCFNFVNFHALDIAQQVHQAFNITEYGTPFEKTTFPLMTNVSGNSRDGFGVSFILSFDAPTPLFNIMMDCFLSYLNRLSGALMADSNECQVEPIAEIQPLSEQSNALIFRTNTKIEYARLADTIKAMAFCRLGEHQCDVSLTEIQLSSSEELERYCIELAGSNNVARDKGVELLTLEQDTMNCLVFHPDCLDRVDVKGVLGLYQHANSVAIQFEQRLNSGQSGSWVDTVAVNRALCYWQNLLHNAPALHELPLDYIRPPRKQHDGALITAHLSMEELHQAKELAVQHGMTLFMLLHSALALVLSRHSQTSDIVLGSKIVAESAQQYKDLVLRVNTDVDKVSDYLAHVNQVHLAAQSNQSIPATYLLNLLQVPGGEKYTPLVQVDFSMVTFQTDAKVADGATEVTYDLEISTFEDANGLHFNWLYDTSLFGEKRIKRLSEHLLNMLRSLLQQQSESVTELQMISEEEYQTLIRSTGISPDAVHEPEFCLLHEWFEAQASRQPEAIAVVDKERQISYGQLNAKANQLAGYLREQGVAPEVFVGIGMGRSGAMLVAMLAVLKAGGAYVSLDPEYPLERLAYMASDTGLRHVLTMSAESNIWSDMPGVEPVILDNEALASRLAQYSEQNLPRAEGHGRDSLAYVIYTSGSTGKPKGVMIENKNVIAMLNWANEFFSDEETRCVLASTSLNFDLSVFESFLPLVKGGKCLIVNSAMDLMQPTSAHQEITLINTVPSAMQTLIDKGIWFENIKTVNLAGEPLKKNLVNQIINHHVSRVNNLYGPSEDTTYSTCFQMRSSVEEEPLIGKPIAGTYQYIVDKYNKLVPFGAVGELLLGGDGVARGYLNQNDTTAAKFTADPFREESNDRVYRTGDLVRYNSSGELQFLGRIDDQVKIRGFRIEPSEIALVLEAHEDVDSARVLAQEAQQGKILKAWVKFVDNKQLRQSEIIDFLSKSLPAHLIPNVIYQVSKWPLLPNGKLDRDALVQETKLAGDMPYVELQGASETRLAQIWSEILNVSSDTIGRTTSFYGLGGHSLLVLKLRIQIEKEWGIEVSLKDLFERNVLKEQAALIDKILLQNKIRSMVENTEFMEEGTL